MLLDALILLTLVTAALPVAMLAVNVWIFRRAPRRAGRAAISLLIPARDEAGVIGDTLRSVLASKDVDLEVIVLDDHSADATAAEVLAIAREDPRVRLEKAPPLPTGWCGKQHACLALSHLARHDLLAWMDADVRLTPDALARMAGELQRRDAALITGFPRQQALTLGEKLIVPLINWLLVSYLPLPGERWTRRPAFAAGCGQLVMARREPYEAIGGHGAVRASMHDGMTLPRAMRDAGHATDLFDAGDLATCRMYRNLGAVWRGFAKNATEGMATPVGIVVWTVLLLGGHVLPWALGSAWAGEAITPGPTQAAMLAAAMAAAAVHSLAIGVRFRQPFASIVLRPVGVAMLIAIQWYALARRLAGRPAGWRGRAYAAG